MMMKLLFVSILLVFDVSAQMRIHEFLTNEFDRKAPAEYTAYKILKEKPLESDVNYLAVPWISLIDRKCLGRAPRHLRLAGGFVICQSIYFRRILPIISNIGIDTCFTPHATKEKYINGIRIMPFPHCMIQTAVPAKEKDIWYSFVGSSHNHIIRKKLLQQKHPENTICIDSGKWFLEYGAEQKRELARQYCDILSRSRFSLCPRGTGPGTFRFWESLAAGAIPVLISDELRLPKEFDWDSCCIRVLESEIDTIPDVLSRITPKQEELMRQMCYKAAEQFSGENFVSTIRKIYDKKGIL